MSQQMQLFCGSLIEKPFTQTFRKYTILFCKGKKLLSTKIQMANRIGFHKILIERIIKSLVQSFKPIGNQAEFDLREMARFLKVQYLETNKVISKINFSYENWNLVFLFLCTCILKCCDKILVCFSLSQEIILNGFMTAFGFVSNVKYQFLICFG